MPFQVFFQQLNNPFFTLRNPNYRIYWLAMSVSSIGIWMQNVAQPWLAYSMTDSPLLLGIVSSVQFLPLFLFSVFAGVLIDRFPKKRLFMLNQTIAALLPFTMFLLIYTNQICYWHILVIAFLMGTVNVINLPLRHVFINELVDKEDLMNAVALYSTAFNFARIVGPALAGFVMAGLGIGICYLINSATFLIVVASLFFIKTRSVEKNPPSTHTVITDVKDGIVYALKNCHIRDILFVLAVTGTFAINYSVLLPVLASEIVEQKEVGFGLLMSMVGIGTFLGAFTIAASSKNGPRQLFLFKAPLIMGALLILIGMCRKNFLIYIALVLTGFFYVSFSSTASTALQLYSPSDYIGRVLSLYNLVLVGTSPLGNLFSGAIANQLGIYWGFIACGLAVFICYGLYFLNRFTFYGFPPVKSWERK
ncbi:MAG: MFS transporter [Bacillota bacterium]|jgi:MFS family permease|nr:MFS transporter [Clostridia bacterium]